jgi:hypothetical protein
MASSTSTTRKAYIFYDKEIIPDTVELSLSSYIQKMKKLKQEIKIEQEQQKEKVSTKATNTYIEQAKHTLNVKEERLKRLIGEKESIERQIQQLEDGIESKKLDILELIDNFNKSKRTPREIKLQMDYDALNKEYIDFTYSVAKQLGLPEEQTSFEYQFSIAEKQAAERVRRSQREREQRKQEEEEKKQRDKEEAEKRRKEEEAADRRRQDERRLKELAEKQIVFTNVIATPLTQTQEEEEEVEEEVEVEEQVQEERPKPFKLPDLPTRKPNQSDADFLYEVEEAEKQNIRLLKEHKQLEWKARQESIQRMEDEDYKKFEHQAIPLALPPASKQKKLVKRGSLAKGPAIHLYSLPEE